MPTHNAVLLGAVFLFFSFSLFLTRDGTAFSDANGPNSLPRRSHAKLERIPQVHGSATKPTARLLFAWSWWLWAKNDAATQWAKSFGGRRESRTAQWLKPVQKRRSKNSFTPSASCHTSPLRCAALRRD